MQPQPPEGWYPDPADPAGQRWWDGMGWTAHRRATVPDWPPPAYPVGSWEPSWPTAQDPSQDPSPSLIPARAAWWALLGLLVGEVVGGIFAVAAVGITGESETGAVPTLLGELGLWFGMIGSCIFVCRRYATGSLRRDLRLAIRWIDVALGLGVGLAGLVVSAILGVAFEGTRFAGTNTQILTGQRGNSAGFVIVTLIAALGAPFFEELFFRGLIRTALSARLGRTGAVWAQAGLFGLAHFEPGNGLGNVSVIVVIGCLGVLLGYTARETGRLGGGMVAHSTFNAIAALAVLLN